MSEVKYEVACIEKYSDMFDIEQVFVRGEPEGFFGARITWDRDSLDKISMIRVELQHVD